MARRTGAALALLCHFDGTEDNFIPTRPIAIGTDYPRYPYNLSSERSYLPSQLLISSR